MAYKVWQSAVINRHLKSSPSFRLHFVLKYFRFERGGAFSIGYFQNCKKINFSIFGKVFRDVLSTVSTIPIDETFRYFKFIFVKTFTSIIFGTIAFSKGGGKEIGKKSAMTSKWK